MFFMLMIGALIAGCAAVGGRRTEAVSGTTAAAARVYELPEMREDKRLKLREIAMPGFYLVFLPLVETLQSPSGEEDRERSRQDVQP
jgi:hypothetical protein